MGINVDRRYTTEYKYFFFKALGCSASNVKGVDVNGQIRGFATQS
jgi:hypothetical protein